MKNVAKRIGVYLGAFVALFVVDFGLAHIFSTQIDSTWFFILSGLCDIIVISFFDRILFDKKRKK